MRRRRSRRDVARGLRADTSEQLADPEFTTRLARTAAGTPAGPDRGHRRRVVPRLVMALGVSAAALLTTVGIAFASGVSVPSWVPTPDFHHRLAPAPTPGTPGSPGQSATPSPAVPQRGGGPSVLTPRPREGQAGDESRRSSHHPEAATTKHQHGESATGRPPNSHLHIKAHMKANVGRPDKSGTKPGVEQAKAADKPHAKKRDEPVKHDKHGAEPGGKTDPKPHDNHLKHGEPVKHDKHGAEPGGKTDPKPHDNHLKHGEPVKPHRHGAEPGGKTHPKPHDKHVKHSNPVAANLPGSDGGSRPTRM